MEFLLVYEHTHTHQLYMDMMLVGYNNNYNSYKKYTNRYHIYLKILQNIKSPEFGIKITCSTSENIIIIRRKHRGMLTYFLKFFYSIVALCIIIFLFCR